MTGRCQALRVALDGVRLLARDVPPDCWRDWGREVILQADRPRVLVWQRGTRVWSGDGVRVAFGSGGDAARVWPLDVHVQGGACAESRDGVAPVLSVAREVARRVWADDVGAWRVGMHDVAVDVESTDGPWLAREAFEDGHLGRLAERIASRTRLRAMHDGESPAQERSAGGGGISIMGTPSTGRSVYAGRVLWYEKDRTGGHARAGRDLPATSRQWRAAGWDGASRVLRIEARCTRADLGPLGLSDVTPEEWIAEGWPWRTAVGTLERTRLTVGGRTRARRAAESELWRVARLALAERAEYRAAPEWRRDPGDVVVRAVRAVQLRAAELDGVTGGDLGVPGVLRSLADQIEAARTEGSEGAIAGLVPDDLEHRRRAGAREAMRRGL